jgi:hypothetical protein
MSDNSLSSISWPIFGPVCPAVALLSRPPERGRAARAFNGRWGGILAGNPSKRYNVFDNMATGLSKYTNIG